MAKAADMLPQVQQLLPKLDSILASVNFLLADPAIANSLHNIEQITGSLTRASSRAEPPDGQSGSSDAPNAGECRRFVGKHQ